MDEMKKQGSEFGESVKYKRNDYDTNQTCVRSEK